MGSLKQVTIPKEEQFFTVDDMKLRLTISTLADKYNDQVRQLIYRAYSDPELLMMYRGIRNSGIWEQGQKTGARHRKVMQFPNGYIFDFLDTVMKELYGPGWLDNDKALRHDLCKPWWVVNKL